MENYKNYIISIIVCALSCGIISQFISNTKRKALMHLIMGTILAICILRPLSQINPEDFLDIPVPDSFSADCFIAEGEKTASLAQEEIIKDACEAYILDKATTLGAAISVHIALNENLIPLFAELSGEADHDVQMQLQAILTTDLGIPKENQKWIWNQENNSS